MDAYCADMKINKINEDKFIKFEIYKCGIKMYPHFACMALLT